MAKRLHIMLFGLKRLIVALFALSQLTPAGFALASDHDGDFTFVMCTADGEKSVSWEEMTGEPSPFEMPASDDHSPCHACPTSCRAGAALEPRLDRMVHPGVRFEAGLFPAAAAAPAIASARPPMPSRAPPSQHAPA